MYDNSFFVCVLSAFACLKSASWGERVVHDKEDNARGKDCDGDTSARRLRRELPADVDCIRIATQRFRRTGYSMQVICENCIPEVRGWLLASVPERSQPSLTQPPPHPHPRGIPDISSVSPVSDANGPTCGSCIPELGFPHSTFQRARQADDTKGHGTLARESFKFACDDQPSSH
ncbi:hypothetical protein C0Q70_08086 [Pomacea canaliculata]|uniref:Uncharacterized protein n=1 Tax=Pomacea canaliculata TaxID=400727 RepID=A0A2T7PGV1_POMCA|nr:hypothetical protein C0Q70_08086 [Pomacea canaliculata]